MALYGARPYGAFKYGSGSTTDISVYPFTAQPVDYGKIKLSWVFPLSTANFTAFSVVRNPMGFPTTADDGDLIYKNTYSGLSGIYGTTAVFTDTGAFYDPVSGSISATSTATTAYDVVNSKTVVLTPAAGNSSIISGKYVTYNSSGLLTGANSGSGIIGGTRVSSVSVGSDGVTYTITFSDYVTISAGTTLTFSSASLALGKTYYYSAFVLTGESWQRVGTALGTSVKNYKTADIMYDTLPAVYTLATPSSSFSSVNKNVDLYNFLRAFGVQYDLIKTKVDNAKNRYDVSNLDGRLIPALMDQMGFAYESAIGLKQARRLLTHASNIYLSKGTSGGLKQLASSFSGYTASINPFVNMFLTLDCSSFEYGTGFWSSSGSSNSKITSTTSADEGAAYAPYSSNYSPAGYPNSSLGFLKATAVGTASGSGDFTFSYGVSQEEFYITTTTSNSSTIGYRYITLTTDTEHGFKVGESVVVQGMTSTSIGGSTTYINGIWKILEVPSEFSFKFFCTAASSSATISPLSTNGTVSIYDPKLYGIPVSAGTAYTFNIYSLAKTVARTVTVGVKWYDRYGTYLSSASSSATNSTYSWTTVSAVNLVAPISAIYAVPYVNLSTFNDSEIHYFDAAQFEAAVTKTSVSSYGGNTLSIPSGNSGIELGSTVYLVSAGAGGGSIASETKVIELYGDTTVLVSPSPSTPLGGTSTVSFLRSYRDARCVDLYLSPVRTNLIINPGFELDTTGWVYVGQASYALNTANVYPTAAVGLGAAVSGSSVKITSGGLSLIMKPARVPISASTPHSLSAYFKATAACTVTMSVGWLTSDSVLIRNDVSAAVSLSTSTFTRVAMTPTATAMVSPANAAFASISFSFSDPGAGNSCYVDSVLFEATVSANQYFDGGTGYNNSTDLVWEQNFKGNRGTASTGKSFYYPNRLTIQSRLNTVLSDYLPMGSTYALFIGTTAT